MRRCFDGAPGGGRILTPGFTHRPPGHRQNVARTIEDASSLLPARLSKRALEEAAQRCTACPLYQGATQAVTGEGRIGSTVMLVGEQPGDREDLEGHPFVGPAGGLLDRMLEEAGIERREAFVTNAVKHFKWKPAGTGKRRIHDKPSRSEIKACSPWLHAELELIDPRVVVCLGATAAQAVIGPHVRVTRDRGRFFEPDEVEATVARGTRVTATLHPSAVLRARNDKERREMRAGVVADLRAAAVEIDGANREASEGP